MFVTVAEVAHGRAAGSLAALTLPGREGRGMVLIRGARRKGPGTAIVWVRIHWRLQSIAETDHLQVDVLYHSGILATYLPK